MTLHPWIVLLVLSFSWCTAAVAAVNVNKQPDLVVKDQGALKQVHVLLNVLQVECNLGDGV